MFFDNEQWPVVGADKPEVVLGVADNTVLVSPRVGGRYKVCIRVPSGIFSFAKNVLKLRTDDLHKRPLKFFLEEDGNGLWYFTLSTLARETAEDLWAYHKLPGWAVRDRCI